MASTRGPIRGPTFLARGGRRRFVRARCWRSLARSRARRALAARARRHRAAPAAPAAAAGARLHSSASPRSAIMHPFPAPRRHPPRLPVSACRAAGPEVALWCPWGLVGSAGLAWLRSRRRARSCLLSSRSMWKLITEALLVAQSTEQAARVPRAQLTDELAGGDRVVQLCVCEAPHSAIHPAGSQPRRKVRNRAPVRPVRDG